MEGPAKRSKKKIIFWDKDGFDGGLPSVEVLLNWMTKEGNYDKWRGSDRNNGNTKEFLLKEIVAALKTVGIEHRSPAQIREKISNIEEKYRLAQDFLSQTGSGITDETTLRAEVLKRCPYYYRLQDVMLDRPSAHPLITSDVYESLPRGSRLHVLGHPLSPPLSANSINATPPTFFVAFQEHTETRDDPPQDRE
eukprot:jgi/Phyca11/102717/e_gw1.7.653.1